MNKNIKEKFETAKEWITSHTKIVMPMVLLFCVAITVFIAINANKKAAQEDLIAAEESVEAINNLDVAAKEQLPELELNIYPQVNELIAGYYSAISDREMVQVETINPYLDETEKMYISELSNFVETYPKIDVYTKPGPVENSFVAYVYSQIKFTEYEKPVPGMQAFYICTDENGNCYINDGQENAVVTDYIKQVSLQSDVVELNNTIAVEYNELVESDEDLKAFLDDLDTRISVSVGEVLAKEMNEENATDTIDETVEVATTVETETPPVTTVSKVKALAVVNIRSSDSETADKVGKAQTGDEFVLLEEKGNGWSKISFEEKDAYVKTEFLEKTEELVADSGTQITEEEEVTIPEVDTQAPAVTSTETTNTETAVAITPSSETTSTTVKVKESVNIRKSASTTGERLALVYAGEKLELLMKQADGWSKVKYKGETGYVKSDFVE